jgi:hypothetical protein
MTTGFDVVAGARMGRLVRNGLIRPGTDRTGIGTRPYGARSVLGRTVSVAHSL